MHRIESYHARKTLIVGDINSGKTARTLEILRRYLAAGWAPHITVMDLAPEAMGKVGGKMPIPESKGLRYLTGPIVPPRLTAGNATQALLLAQENARRIVSLFESFAAHPTDVLFVNDASLYLQAGDLTRLQSVMDIPETVILNAYLGDSFPDSALTRREKRRVLELMQYCDQVIPTS